MQRRTALKALLLAASPLPGLAASAQDKGLVPIRINIPGPHLLPFVPIELIPRLGLDRAVGAQLAIRYLPSGVQSLEDVIAGNAHFAGVAFSVLPTFLANNKPVKAIAVLGSGTPPYSVLIRNDLVGRIRSLKDLKGRSIGVAMGNSITKTYLQMLMELWLQANGVKSHEVRWVPTGQNYEAMLGALAGGVVDALFCEEPLAGALARKQLGHTLASLADPKNPVRMVGQEHLRGVITSTPEYLEAHAESARMMAWMVRSVLRWMQATPVRDIVAHLGLADPEFEEDMRSILIRLPGLFSRDGRFSAGELASTRQFMKVAGITMPNNRDISTLIADRWINQTR